MPIRARSAEDGGGAAGPSTVEGKIEMVKIFLKMKCFSLPPHAGPGDALKGASLGLGGNAEPFFFVVLCWQNDKFCECLLGMPSFQCIRGGQCAAPNGLPDAGPGGAPKGASPGLGGGAESFFSVVLCWQNVKICECLLATPSFQCIGAGSVPPPISCRTLGRAMR